MCELSSLLVISKGVLHVNNGLASTNNRQQKQHFQATTINENYIFIGTTALYVF